MNQNLNHLLLKLAWNFPFMQSVMDSTQFACSLSSYFKNGARENWMQIRIAAILCFTDLDTDLWQNRWVLNFHFSLLKIPQKFFWLLTNNRRSIDSYKLIMNYIENASECIHSHRNWKKITKNVSLPFAFITVFSIEWKKSNRIRCLLRIRIH